MSILRLSDFNYNLPQNLIAQKPTKPRDHCRLLILDRKTGDIQHRKFFEIEKFLQKGDIIILNDSMVIPARLLGNKVSGGKIEILLIKKITNNKWEAMLKNFKRKEFGKKIFINKNFFAIPSKNIGEGLWQIKFNLKNAALNKAIHKYGQTPLPPYIKKSASRRTKLVDYQTIYAQKDGSVAAPTAGLHFTKSLINKLKSRGIIFEKITPHIGLGTFSPIRGENIEKHKMHSEFAQITARAAKAINKAKAEGRRIIAVGTTSARTLEAFAIKTKNKKCMEFLEFSSFAHHKNKFSCGLTRKNKKYHQSYDRRINDIFLKNGKDNIDIFIKPGYKFKIVDGMITNFHLPETTLMILVSAFAGREKILRAYNEAINKKYKFFSFGDAMLII